MLDAHAAVLESNILYATALERAEERAVEVQEALRKADAEHTARVVELEGQLAEGAAAQTALRGLIAADVSRMLAWRVAHACARRDPPLCLDQRS
jgi:hypothetical protein